MVRPGAFGNHKTTVIPSGDLIMKMLPSSHDKAIIGKPCHPERAA